jgi:hypothetical protein
VRATLVKDVSARNRRLRALVSYSRSPFSLCTRLAGFGAVLARELGALEATWRADVLGLQCELSATRQRWQTEAAAADEERREEARLAHVELRAERTERMRLERLVREMEAGGKCVERRMQV